MTVTETLTTADARKLRGGRRPKEDRRPMTARRWMRKYLVGIIAIIVSIVVFLMPFVFVFLQSAKSSQEAGLVEFSFPTDWQFWPNLVEVLEKNDYQVLWAFLWTTVITVFACAIMVMPATICRLKKMYMISGGMVVSRMYMNSRLNWLTVWLWKL